MTRLSLIKDGLPIQQKTVDLNEENETALTCNLCGVFYVTNVQVIDILSYASASNIVCPCGHTEFEFKND